MQSQPLPPGSTIGILGGGQLGQMMAMAATKLGFKTHIYCPEKDCPAANVAEHHTAAEYSDVDALKKFAESVDVVTLEFENIPLQTAKTVEEVATLYPSSHVLGICQHRMKEKQFINSCNIATAPFAPACNIEEAKQAANKVGLPCIFKTCTMGYDGKGQTRANTEGEIETAWKQLASNDVIAEGFVNFNAEASVIVARNKQGEVICYPLVENVHKNHILHQTTAPAELPDTVAQKAEKIAVTLANKLDLIGIMAVELFVSGNELAVNELAPRPHNSGHWTIDACDVSQFEQVIRAITGMPLKEPNQHSSAVMTNLIGDDIHNLDKWKQEGYYIHNYGKKEAKPGRKMGHVTHVTRFNQGKRA